MKIAVPVLYSVFWLYKITELSSKCVHCKTALYFQGFLLSPFFASILGREFIGLPKIHAWISRKHLKENLLILSVLCHYWFFFCNFTQHFFVFFLWKSTLQSGSTFVLKTYLLSTRSLILFAKLNNIVNSFRFREIFPYK